MMNKYDMGKRANNRWEVFEVVTGKVVTVGGMVLSGLDQDVVKGAVYALRNQIIEPNGATQRSSDDSTEGV